MSANHTNKIGIRELGALTMWVRSVVGKHFTVQFVEGLPAPMIDAHGYMKLPMPNSRMTVADAIKLRGWCIHETSHPMYQPDGFDILIANPMRQDSKLGFVFNMLMDVHCETRRYQEWEGDGKALSEYGAVLGHELSPKVTSSLSKSSPGDDYYKTVALLYTCITAESAWNVGLAIGFNDLFKSLPNDIVTLGEEILHKFKIRERLVDGAKHETSQSIFDLAKEVYAFLYDADPEQEIQKKGKGKGEDKDKGKPEKGEGEPEEGEGEEGKGEESESDADGDPKDGEGKEGKGKLKKKPKINEMLRSDHYETMNGNGHGMGFDFTEYRVHETYTPVDFARFKFVNYKKGERR